MKLINMSLAVALAATLFSCADGAPSSAPDVNPQATPTATQATAEGREIVYNVYLKPQDFRDPYAPELYEGFDREAFVDSLFAAVYLHRAKVTDMSGAPLTIDDIKQREVEDPNYSRDKVACVQFREVWDFSPSSMSMVKKVKTMLIGYEVVEDSAIVTLRPGFVLNF